MVGCRALCSQGIVAAGTFFSMGWFSQSSMVVCFFLVPGVMTQYRLSERQNTKVGGWPVSKRTASTLHTPGPTTSRFQHWSLKKRVHWKATSSVMSRNATQSLSPRREMSAMCASCFSYTMSACIKWQDGVGSKQGPSICDPFLCAAWCPGRL